MNKLSWPAAAVIFLVFFGTYSHRLGIRPELWHDDYEYTYPSYSLAERGELGSPLLGTGLDIHKRTYSLIVYYYSAVHAVLIRQFGYGVESIPLANTFHFALLAAWGAFLLLRRGAALGVFVFLYGLVSDERMVEAARHGRPEMTAGLYLTLAAFGLWLRLGEGRRSPAVLLGAGAALTAAMLSHTSTVFFTIALAAAFARPLARQASLRDALALLLPFLAIPALYFYFFLTDAHFLANLRGQLGPAQGDVVIGRLLLLLLHGEWRELASLAAAFLAGHAGPTWLWLGLPIALLVARFVPLPCAAAARFFAGIYCLLFFAHFLCLKPFVLWYRSVYQAIGYAALAFLAEAVVARAGAWLRRPAGLPLLRVACAAALLGLGARDVFRFREGLHGQRPPYGQLAGALHYVLSQSGARPGDRVFVPSPFAFHLKRRFDVIAYPAPKYYQGRWSAAFRDGLRAIWGPEVVAQVDAQSLCYAMGLAFVRPAWLISWDSDYGVVQPLYQFLRKYPDLPGMYVTRLSSATLPPLYGGPVRVYRLQFTPEVDALDRTYHVEEQPCP
jgi:hypothetical protein